MFVNANELRLVNLQAHKHLDPVREREQSRHVKRRLQNKGSRRKRERLAIIYHSVCCDIPSLADAPATMF